MKKEVRDYKAGKIKLRTTVIDATTLERKWSHLGVSGMWKLQSIGKAFAPEEARRLAKRLDIHYPPKHGSWLNIAEIELSVLKGQCLENRIPDVETMRSAVHTWESQRNNRRSKVNGQFTTASARIKLKRLYPNL